MQYFLASRNFSGVFAALSSCEYSEADNIFRGTIYEHGRSKTISVVKRKIEKK